jgi:hypothetical protein
VNNILTFYILPGDLLRLLPRKILWNMWSYRIPYFLLLHYLHMPALRCLRLRLGLEPLYNLLLNSYYYR